MFLNDIAIRTASAADATEIQNIYSHYVNEVNPIIPFAEVQAEFGLKQIAGMTKTE